MLFGTTKNAVFNQLFAALIAYVILRWLYTQGKKQPYCKKLSFAGFLRMLLCDTLQIEWKLALQEITRNRLIIYELIGLIWLIDTSDISIYSCIKYSKNLK